MAAKAPVAIELPVTEVAAIAAAAAVGLLHKVSDCCCACGCCCCCCAATVVGVCKSGSPLAMGDVLPETLPSPPPPLPLSVAAAAVAAAAATVTLDGELQSGELGSPPPPGVPPPPPPPPACGNAEFCCGSAASLAINTVDCGEERNKKRRMQN